MYPWRTYLRESNCDGRGLGVDLTSRKSHESVIVSMTFNDQPAHSIDEDLLCVSFINIWLEMPNSRRSSLCLSGGDEFTKGKFKATSIYPESTVRCCTTLFLFYNLMICFIMHYCYFVLSSLKLKLLGGLLEFWVKN